MTRASGAAGAVALIVAWAAASGVPCEPGRRRGEHVLILPGVAKQQTVVSLLVDARELSVSAFVVRHPDENHEAFYRWMLRRNARLPGLAFALDGLGDVFLVGVMPLPALSEASLDALLGAVLTVADESFNELLTLGFSSSITREWAWRLNRGEPTDNLAAFEHLRPQPGTQP